MTKNFIRKNTQLSVAECELKEVLGDDCPMVNVGKLFIAFRPSRRWSRKQFYEAVSKSGLGLELFVVNKKCFIGTEEHANALKDAFGGKVEEEGVIFHSEPRPNFKKYRIWYGDLNNKTPLNLWMIENALF